jgi:hypothetical protein
MRAYGEIPKRMADIPPRFPVASEPILANVIAELPS